MQTTKCTDCGFDVPCTTTKCPECGCPIEHPSELSEQNAPNTSAPTDNSSSNSMNGFTGTANDFIGTGFSLWNIDIGQYCYESFMIAKHTFFHRFFSFRGRATRREFWAFWFCWEAIPLAWVLFFPVVCIMMIAAIFPWLGVTIRRLHDNGHSGWWIFVPPFCFFYCLQENNPYPNEYGDVPSTDILF